MKKNSKFQKTTDLKKEQISKNNKSQKIGMIKSYFLEFGVVIVICSLFKINVYCEICCFFKYFVYEKCCLLKLGVF